MAQKIMGVANYIDWNAAKEENLDSMRPCTLQRVQEDARKWQIATSQKEHKWLYNKNGVRHSVLMELEYWNPTTMVPVDCMHLFFIGLLQYHMRTVLGTDSLATRNPKILKTTTKQLEGARNMPLHSSTELLELEALTLDALKVLCDKMGIDVNQPGEVRKEYLIESLKV